ncbi:MAG: MtrB/PioB family outer membrane beta-barrel protein, partial [Proteobacteria bacterium]|nr:MtrB/PioB family outer membrane beta-barrel protein [Pseudomonadota bacterium]
DRSYRSVKRTEENTYKAGLTSSQSNLSMGLNYARSKKTADGGYDHLRVFETYHTDNFITTEAATPATYWDSHPDLRRYDIADRERDKLGFNVTIMGMQNTSVGLYYSAMEDDYDKSAFGLQDRDNINYTVDITTSPSNDLSFYAFYTREETDMTQASRDIMGAGPPVDKATTSQNPARDWSAIHDDNNDTVGLGTKVGFLGGDLTFDANYLYSRSITSINFTSGGGLGAVSGLPDLQTKRHTFDLTGKYKINKKMTVGAGYEYENYRSDDWVTDGFDPAFDAVDFVLTLTDAVPDYKAHLCKLFLTYKM